MSRHLLCCALLCCAVRDCVCACVCVRLRILYAIDQWKWLNYIGTTNYSPISSLCVCECALVHAQQCTNH